MNHSPLSSETKALVLYSLMINDQGLKIAKLLFKDSGTTQVDSYAELSLTQL